jgi:CubicO group peptidase (beta-lactamase class C family)
MKKALSSLFFLCFTIASIAQNADKPNFVRDSLDKYVARGLKNWQTPGVAIGIVKEGKVVLLKGYGVCEANKAEKVDEHTLFMIGSNTKAFTGTLLALLEQEQRCSLQDKVQKWLPDFQMKDAWIAKELNLTDIVSHRIGMETFQGDFMYWTSNLSTQQAIEKFGKLTPQYGFRTKWGYCNLGFTIAGECIQKISGKSWADLLKEKIFTPLAMNRTIALSANISQATNTAKAHTVVENQLKLLPYCKIDNLAPAGSISSSVADMSHWLLAQLDSGKYQGNTVIPFNALQTTREPQSILGRTGHRFNKKHYALYALGWELEDYEGREIISHTGGVNGFVTSVTLVPEEKLGIVILTNTDENGLFVSLKDEILDAYLQLPYRNYDDLYFKSATRRNQQNAEIIKALRDTARMQPKPIVALKSFEGKYQHEVYGTIDIKQTGSQLTMYFEHHPNLQGKLESLGGTRFLCTYSDPVFGIRTIPFVVENQQVKSFQLRVADFVEFTEYNFVKTK